MNTKLFNSQASKGFTLIEMLVTLTIVAILISIATPFFISILKSWEARQIRSYVTDSYRISRSESLIRRQNVIMCPADINDICHKDATESILVFTDTNNNLRYDTSTDVMLSKLALNLNYGRIYLRAGRRHHIKFFADTGLPRGHFGHIKYCPTDNQWSNMYQVSINQLGIQRFKPRSLHDTGCP